MVQHDGTHRTQNELFIPINNTELIHLHCNSQPVFSIKKNWTLGIDLPFRGFEDLRRK